MIEKQFDNNNINNNKQILKKRFDKIPYLSNEYYNNTIIFVFLAHTIQ